MRRERIELALALVLAAGAVATGVAVIAVKHDARRLFAELEELKREQDRLQVDWGRLQLEQSTWATHARIETLARDELQLSEPDPARVRIVVGEAQ